MSQLLSRFKEWLGWFEKSDEPTVIFYGATRADFDTSQGLIQSLINNGGRLNVSLFSTRASDWRGRGIMPLPVHSRPAMAVFLSTMKVRCIVALSPLPKALLAACEKRGTAVVGTDLTPDEIVKIVGRERAWQQRTNRPVGRYLAEHLHRQIEAGNGRSGKVRRFNHLDDLKQHLGQPQTILCLGNGPSSEDEQVLSIQYDALFRANHSWLARGILVSPDVVFTGMQASMKKLTNTVLCVLGQTTEKVLLMVRAKAVISGGLEYVVAGPKTSALPLEMSEDFRPTSGAVMVAMAVALKPQKLVIAGIDMFAHPDGAYPGDNKTPNAYTATHSYDHELNFILAQLDKFEGELEILSDVLEKEWQAYKRASRKP